MEKCKRCYSYAINHHCHGRDGSEPQLCDVCFWRKQTEMNHKLVENAEACKLVLKLENDRLRGKLEASMKVLDSIEARCTDGEGTCADFRFMGAAARTFLENNTRAQTA